ncbi:hypothetical protein FB451DRAFT_41436 [Mycena latifolia]|nr:hypothetical protein FB451DRAFT_41436 [Mycena latifolia]
MQQLDDDILLHMLEDYCDIFTLVAVSQVNAHFYTLAFSKQIWLAHVRELARRLLIDTPSDEILQQYTSDNLVDEVRRVVVGPKTWTDKRPVSLVPESSIHRQIVLSNVPTPPTLILAQLLAGGRYLLIVSETSTEIWETQTGRRAWGRDQLVPLHTICAIELLANSTVTLLLIRQGAINTLSVTRIHLSTGKSKEMLAILLVMHDPSASPMTM